MSEGAEIDVHEIDIRAIAAGVAPAIDHGTGAREIEVPLARQRSPLLRMLMKTGVRANGARIVVAFSSISTSSRCLGVLRSSLRRLIVSFS